LPDLQLRQYLTAEKQVPPGYPLLFFVLVNRQILYNVKK
jgi:hypothetical protein